MKRILTRERNCSEMVPVDGSGLLVDGEAYYRAFYESALRAKKSILMAGWQFDTEVALLRGQLAERAGGDVRLLSFLNGLCERNPDLHIHVLAWDYSFIYALEREWLQQMVFELKAHPHIHFKFDNNTPMWSSHHQKFVVVDGELGFVGGMDLCEHRWDDRRHAADNPLRVKSSGLRYNPFHDIQAFIKGREACEPLVKLFAGRWKDALGEYPVIHLPHAHAHRGFVPHELVGIHGRHCAISRTAPQCTGNPRPCEEIAHLFSDAILAAERSIYIETQYMSAKAIEEALVRRMLMRSSGPLEIVVVLPQHPGEIKERLFVGLAQAKLLKLVREVAETTGHHLGVYYAVDVDSEGREVPTYIHSKLLSVDDRFLTVGSANMTNRSMGVDTEVHISWESHPHAPDHALIASIAEARVNLMAEHSGMALEDARQEFLSTENIVERLDHLARAKGTRLRLQEEVSAPEEAVLPFMDMESLTVFDPDKPGLIDEEFGREWKEFFAGGIDALGKKVRE